ncbi:MAG: hypothetical protein AB8B96_17890 [Lysobacterales bacterium]
MNTSKPNTSSFLRWAALAASLAVATISYAQPVDTSAPVAMEDAPQRLDQGWLYGTVELDDDRVLTGTLRWDEQEAAWTHHFNGDKARPFDLSALDDADREAIESNLPGPRFEINGHVIELVRWLGSEELQPQFFSLEFGHIAELEVRGGERVRLTLRDGSVLDADGGSDDIGADVEVLTGPGQIEVLDWDSISKIRFHAPETAPERFSPYMYGQVQTRNGTFEGFVDWDQDERYPEDELDGDVDGAEQSIRFSTIVSIQNEGESSRVELKDGRTLSMSDTNDVNSENRGIVIYMADMGKVMVPWTAFEKVTYFDPSDNLPSYAEYADYGPINAQVVHNNTTTSGFLVFDLDQQHQGEMLRGKDAAGIQYEIPWRLIERLTPENNTARVLLKSGRSLTLGKDPDVTGSNLGIGVKTDGTSVTFIPWESLSDLKVVH